MTMSYTAHSKIRGCPMVANAEYQKQSLSSECIAEKRLPAPEPATG